MIKKVKEKIVNKKMLIYFLSFIIPVIILFGYVLYNEIMTDRDFFMNGENFLTADMGGQYNALYNYIRNVFLGKDSIFYSFHNSLGGNMASTIGYYLSSPFNILYIFVKKSDIPLMTYIIYVIKISLCSLFMNIYVGHKFGNRYSNLIFSLTYAFMGFVVVYFFNSMWLDVIYMTPLVIMGIDKLIDGKPLQYIITLCLSIIFNFYIAYMLCIFCVIYFVYELFIKYNIKDFKSYKKIILRFIISSLLAGGLSAFFLIPVLLDLRNSMRVSIDNSMLGFNFNNFPQRLLNTIFSKTLIEENNRFSMLGRLRPVIYISLFSLILAYLYFFNKKIKLKEKMLSLFIILFFVMSFMIPYLQLFWQLSFPNGYIDRYSFLFCFFLILLAAKCFYNKSKINVIWFILYFLVYAFFVYRLYYLKLPFLNNNYYLITLITILIYLILTYIYFNVKIKNSKDIIFLIFIVVITELTYNYSKNLILMKNSGYGDYYKTACKQFNSIEDSFYRIDGSYLATLTDSFACDTYTITTGLSTSNSNLYKFYYDHGGSETKIGLYSDFNGLPVLNSILGIKYIVNTERLNNPQYQFLRKIKSDNFFGMGDYSYIYKNNDALSLGYIIDSDFEKKYETTKSRLDNLNNILKSLSGEDKNILVKIPKQYTNEENLYRFHIDKNDDYLYLTTDYEISLNFALRYQLIINDKIVDAYNDAQVSVNRLKNKYYNQDIEIRLANLSSSKIYDFDLYNFDRNNYEDIIDKLKRKQMTNINVKNNTLKGEINLNKDGLMFLSIPYDKGWHIYVDGEKVSYKKLANTFIGIDLKQGYHKIYMKFYPKGLILGIIVSIFSICLSIFYAVILYKTYKK